MNLYKYILSILFPVVLSVLTFSCKEEAGIELFQNLDIVGEVPVQEGSLRCTVLHGGTINVYGGVGKYDVFSSDEETVQVEMVENRYMRFYALKSGQATLTVMDDAHNASEICISVEPYLRNIWLYEVGYQVTADDKELQTSKKNSLSPKHGVMPVFSCFLTLQKEDPARFIPVIQPLLMKVRDSPGPRKELPLFLRKATNYTCPVPKTSCFRKISGKAVHWDLCMAHGKWI